MPQQTPTPSITLAQSLAALEVANSHKAIGNFTGALIAKLKDDPAMIPLAFGVADWLEGKSDPRMNINAFTLYEAGLQALKGKYCVPDEATYEDAQDILTQEEKDTLYKQVHTQVPQIIERVLATFETGYEDDLLLAASDCAASCFAFDPTQASPKLVRKMVNILLEREFDYNHPFYLLAEMAADNPVIFQTSLDQVKERCLLDENDRDSLRRLCVHLGDRSPETALSMFQTIRELTEGFTPQDEIQFHNIDAALASVDSIAGGPPQWRSEILQPAIDLLGDCLISADSQHTQAIYASPFAETAVEGLHALPSKHLDEMEGNKTDTLLRRMTMLYAAEPKQETAKAIQTFCRTPPRETRIQAVRETIGHVLDKRPDEQKRNVLQLLNYWQAPRHLSDALIDCIIDDTLFEKIATCAVEFNENTSFEMANRVLKQQCTTPERSTTLVSIGAAALSKWFFNKQKAGLGLIETALKKHTSLRDEPTKQLVTDFLAGTKQEPLQEQAQRILNLYGPSATPEVKEESKPTRPDPNVPLNKLTQELNRSTSQNPALG